LTVAGDIVGPALAAADSTANLAQVQAGFSSPSSISDKDLNTVLWIAGAIVLAILVAGLINWRRRRSQSSRGWSSITNSQTIWDILSKAVARQAHFVLDIYRANRVINYKGLLTGLEDSSMLILSLSETPSVDADFNDLPGVVHINFRPALKEPMEHYQFATKILAMRFVKVETWREAQMALPLPKVITSAQRRSFLRIEPTGEMAFDCALHSVPDGSIPDLSVLEEVCRGDVMDISIGGAQIKLASHVALKETQRFVGVMRLPIDNLNVELGDPTLVVLMQLMSQEYIQASAQLGHQAQTILRVRFLGRYLKDKLHNVLIYRGLTQTSLEDLSHWMSALQRYQLKSRSNLHSPQNFSRPVNMFPSQPPERPPLRDDTDD
jgi:hypothetical protein